LIAWNHLVYVLSLVCLFPWIALSHHRTQTRWAASKIRTCKSLEVPCSLIDGFYRCCSPCGCMGCIHGCSLLMHPMPRISLRIMTGHCSRVCGHACSARFQTIHLVFAGHCVRMWSIKSNLLHAVQNCCCWKPGICFHIAPIMYI